MTRDFRATYRLMFAPGFGFREARALVPYLRDLGVSHPYLPPSFQARAGSMHGYDVVHPGEKLGGWQVRRAVGYEFLNAVCALFVDPRGRALLDALWRELSVDPRPFGEYAFAAKHEQASGVFLPDVERLARGTPFAVDALARAVSSLPIYRTYVEPWSGLVDGADRTAIGEA